MLALRYAVLPRHIHYVLFDLEFLLVESNAKIKTPPQKVQVQKRTDLSGARFSSLTSSCIFSQVFTLVIFLSNQVFAQSCFQYLLASSKQRKYQMTRLPW